MGRTPTGVLGRKKYKKDWGILKVDRIIVTFKTQTCTVYKISNGSIQILDINATDS